MVNKISAEEFYDELAANYDDVLKDPKCNVQHIHEAAKIFHQYNYHQGSILDIGCGTGFLSELLQGNFEYTGIDISSKILDYAAKRGYKTIHKSIETALPEIDTNSYDFVFCLGSLLFVEDSQTAIEHITRIARQAILISIDETTEEFIKNVVVPVYDHSKITIENAIEDYFILGWTSPTTGIPIRTRMIYIEQKN
ncbi:MULTISPECIES: class I SAM-dependent methyltransferase [Okeania]|uniref:Class I SAM-dependent methyltransferase n=2 Tax=Okeania hirsuta TaxID=1458930 RepID=A0A3N6R845_9CYAN|nr:MULTISPECIES: class I SAM-dependent methyltransferase [Okeania]NET15676.1 class I SAM-dependent methyltransferase [Okeania sp. SIO1H6]NES75363.1 class I SAM-dependent methyltransferase [Okeania sp. SIO1H4]NES91195.1 class I SAM-dependent methyltransferase [Okeania sp. SIO2B9]NET19098.1 class I SAM-dependent methyltransferase [Okeania sp. SIO1H5]NET78479.1 class I SAM-dependent methyltransferase [Okeania sp. SIO1F9]